MFHVSALFCLIALYFLPTIVASSRHLPQTAGIALLNVFLGWTFIGWVAALVWAIVAPAPYFVYPRPPYPPYYR